MTSSVTVSMAILVRDVMLTLTNVLLSLARMVAHAT